MPKCMSCALSTNVLHSESDSVFFFLSIWWRWEAAKPMSFPLCVQKCETTHTPFDTQKTTAATTTTTLIHARYEVKWIAKTLFILMAACWARFHIHPTHTMHPRATSHNQPYSAIVAMWSLISNLICPLQTMCNECAAGSGWWWLRNENVERRNRKDDERNKQKKKLLKRSKSLCCDRNSVRCTLFTSTCSTLTLTHTHTPSYNS